MTEITTTESTGPLFVVKRNGSKQKVRFDKVTERIKKMCLMKPILDPNIIDPSEVAQTVIRGIYPGVKTTELDELAAETAAYRSQKHPHYDKLAARLIVSSLHKQTSGDFVHVFCQLRDYVNTRTGEIAPMVGELQYQFVLRNADAIRKAIKYNRDYQYTYFGYKTLERSYLMQCNGRIVERPQDMLMRVAVGIHCPMNDTEKDCLALESVLETYHLLSKGMFIHATPTLFNACAPNPQMSSCFLLTMSEDSIEGIYETLKKCALISKSAGGIGLSVSNIRAAGSYIRGTNGQSNGLVPMLRVFNDTARYVDQCFTPETLIQTETGWQPIGQLQIGQKVWTHKGLLQSIDRVLEHRYTGKMLQISIESKENSISVTLEHQILAVQKQESTVDLTTFCHRLEKGLAKAEMVDASLLQVGDFVCFPVVERDLKQDAFTYKDMLYCRIKDIGISSVENAKVYDLEVQQDHTYVTEMGIVHNGGGKRKGAFAVYLEPWHADIFDFLELKKNHGNEHNRARDLFYGLWIPDLFMQRVESGENWSLFCPSVAKGLCETHGPEFETLYRKYEEEGKALKSVKAQDLWRAIVESQIETGTPYMLYKDACNAKSNQKNLGTIRSSNLCCEIIEYTAPDQIAVCNLASIALPKFVSEDGLTFDHAMLAQITQVVTRNLNKIIDFNYYPVVEARNSNLQHRPIGVGVQGLADVFITMRVPFASETAKQLNKEIFETIYYSALSASCDLARKLGKPYSSFAGSPLSKGQFQFDLWGELPESERPGSNAFGRWDWKSLRQRVMKYGVLNSLLIAPMPTASTSQILGNNECIEPYTSNMYVRRVLSGEFAVVNKHLVSDLDSIGMWTEGVRNEIVRNKGSIQQVHGIPQDLKKLYETVWEIKQRSLIDMVADRGIYVDQSQSFNVHIPKPTFGALTSMHFYGWKKGLKTGMYYLRSKAATDAIQFTVSNANETLSSSTTENTEEDFCTMKDGCLTCGS